MAFMRAVNPCVDWTETQWRLIVDEACVQPFTYCMLQYNLPCLLGGTVVVYNGRPLEPWALFLASACISTP